MIRAFAIVVVLLLGGQAFASGARVMVCKYTGRVMADCPCPPAPDAAQLERQGCCDIFASAPFAPTAVVRDGAQLPQALDLALALPPPLSSAGLSAIEPVALPKSQAPPDQRRRFLELLHLLK